MAHYQGWNEEESSRVGRSQEEVTYTASGTLRHPTSSFISINRGHTNSINSILPSTRTIDPLKILRKTDIYDLQDEITSLPTPGGKKRPESPSKNGRAKTSPSSVLSNKAPAEDCDSDHLEVSSPKRRKIHTKGTKGTQPIFKIPSRVQSTSVSGGLRDLSSELNDGSSVSQFTTSPEVHKRSKKRVSSALLSKRKKSPELFESLIITKPSLPSFTLKHPREQSQSINRLQGFTTTEEQLKLNSNGIANTTLQKLAAFKYVPCNEDPAVDQPRVASKTADNRVALNQYHDGHVFEEPNQPSTDYGHMLSGSFFEEALWIPKQLPERNDIEVTCPNVSGIHYRPKTAITSAIQQIPDHVECSLKQFEYISTATGVGALENVSNEVVFSGIDRQQVQQGPPVVGNNEFSQLTGMNSELQNHKPQVYVHLPSTSSEQEQAHAETLQDSTIPPPMSTSVRRQADIQVEQLNIGDSEPEPTNAPQDYVESDDFDDDIDDEDLLALVTDPAVPETSTESHIAKGTAMQSLPPWVPYRADLACTVMMHPHPTVNPVQEIAHSASSSVVVDEEDDYPLDADLEEEMLRLAETSQVKGVVETFEPPSNLTLPPDGDDTDREVYDNTLQFSSPTSLGSASGEIRRVQSTDLSSPSKPPATNEDADWRFITSTAIDPAKTPVPQHTDVLAPSIENKAPGKLPSPFEAVQTNLSKTWLDDSHEYLPLTPFARPKFPPLVQDRCPVNGMSSHTILRVCFRIGEMLNEGGRCNALGQDAIVELFARVNFSSREPGTTKQHFQFADLFHDRPPFAKGILANFKTTGLAESESKVFTESSETLMTRCLGRLKRDVKNGAWLLHIINVRVTDWEEIRWTKRIVCGEHEEKVR
ncbi:20af2e9f-e403-4255-afdb-2eb36a5c02d2 [Sclerotinia trifoliorum]|uniref:20af2e9f-e403-4255-afdb-2eb36a5c02d2 n=1 Tax=Sclerotinia trifoliorum TaxID=28548 RepID=A0A8H2W2G3_9HELO|nr:20af2e9f-e403-4255-afdb-2eb36a5c02d2 [Sclerotinia trifoliorum]